MTKHNTDLSYRAMVTRELCAAKKTTLTLRVFSEKRSSSSSSSEQEPGYSVIGSRQHFLWGGSDACQVTSDIICCTCLQLLTLCRGTRGGRCTPSPGTRPCSSGWSTGARDAPGTTLWVFTPGRRRYLYPFMILIFPRVTYYLDWIKENAAQGACAYKPKFTGGVSKKDLIKKKYSKKYARKNYLETFFISPKKG